MTSAEKGEGLSKNAAKLRTNSIDFADQERGGGQKIPKSFGRHIWKHPKYLYLGLSYRIRALTSDKALWTRSAIANSTLPRRRMGP